MDTKKIVESICFDYTQISLVNLCKFYYIGMKKDPAKSKRHDLEQLAFIILSLNIKPSKTYNIYTNEKPILLNAPGYKAIDYFFKKTNYFWPDEPEYPITRDNRQQRVYIQECPET